MSVISKILLERLEKVAKLSFSLQSSMKYGYNGSFSIKGLLLEYKSNTSFENCESFLIFDLMIWLSTNSGNAISRNSPWLTIEQSLMSPLNKPQQLEQTRHSKSKMLGNLSWMLITIIWAISISSSQKTDRKYYTKVVQLFFRFGDN